MVEAIRKNGEIGHPLTVRPVDGGMYEVVDGEYRYAAALELGMEAVPCRIRNLTDKQALLVGLYLDTRRRRSSAYLANAWALADVLEFLDLRPVDFVSLGPYNKGEVSEAQSFARDFPRAAMQDAAAEANVPFDLVCRANRKTLRRLRTLPEADRPAGLVKAVQEATQNKENRDREHSRVLGRGAVLINDAVLRSLSLLEKFRLIVDVLKALAWRSSP